jgi:hypothetical protein
MLRQASDSLRGGDVAGQVMHRCLLAHPVWGGVVGGWLVEEWWRWSWCHDMAVQVTKLSLGRSFRCYLTMSAG